MRRRLTFVVAAVALLACVNAYAHHSFAATYIEGESVTIEGDLATFELRNPHSFVNVMVKDAAGATVRYVVEWASPSQLLGKITRDTLKAGDHIIVTGNPARNPDDHRVRLVTLRRPKDGWSWGLAADEVITR
jgi:exonuclease VII large subunit